MGLGVSFVIGVSLVINRLNDFRKTTFLVQKRKLKFENDHKIKSSNDIDTLKFEIMILKSETNKLGERTWLLLKWQIWSFAVGTVLGVIYIIIIKNIYN